MKYVCGQYRNHNLMDPFELSFYSHMCMYTYAQRLISNLYYLFIWARQGLLYMLGRASISFEKIWEKYVGNQSKLSNSWIFKGNFGEFRRDEWINTVVGLGRGEMELWEENEVVFGVNVIQNNTMFYKYVGDFPKCSCVVNVCSMWYFDW